MQRRTFLKQSALAAGAGALWAATPTALAAVTEYRKRMGLQLYTLREALGRDTPGTIRAVAEAGYHQVELYGFPKADAMHKAAREAGLEVYSTHFEWDCVVQPKDKEMSDFRKVLEQAEKSGLKHLVVPYLHDRDRRTLDDYRRVADHCNQAASLCREAGLRLSYHNHSFEFEPKEGRKSGFDIFIERFAKDMHFELDVFWVQVAGISPVELIGKLKGRVSQLHLKDLQQDIATPNFSGGLPASAFQPLGSGVIPMAPILAAAAAAGVEHCHVEQDQSPDALADIRKSMAHLAAL